MELFTKRIGTIFLKDSSDASIFIEKLQAIQKKAPEEMKKKIETQIKLAAYGEMGENNIAFELKNSGMDMYVLRDIYFEIGDLSAQIDYIVITRKHIYVLECKNLIGNIEIDNGGNFIRTYELFGKRIKEGIYSPITQNQRHLQVLREIRKSSKGNFLSKLMFEKFFEENYKSVVILANPKTYLNAKYAKKEIKQQVIRADQLIAYIKNVDSATRDSNMSAGEMLDLAQFYLAQSQNSKSDYAKKYEELLEGLCANDSTTDGLNAENNVTKDELIKRLKAFRLEQSRQENISAYYIFNNAQMEDLIDKYPKNKEELLKVSGFGNMKVEKYGDAILEILNREHD